MKRRELLTVLAAAALASALYPLELYVVTPEQVMHYLPDGHQAETRDVSDLRPGLKDAAVGQASVGAAPVVIVVAAVPSRLSHRYGDEAEAFVQIEVGHAAQNILLQAAASDLPPCPWAALIPHGRRTPSPCPPIRPSCT